MTSLEKQLPTDGPKAIFSLPGIRYKSFLVLQAPLLHPEDGVCRDSWKPPEAAGADCLGASVCKVREVVLNCEKKGGV